MYINCYIFKYLTMKEKDNGITILAKENCDNRISPKETEDRSDISDKNSLKNEEILCSKNEDKNNKIEEQNDNRLKIDEIENNKNEVKLKNCVDKIDLDKNLIVLNKKNLIKINNNKVDININSGMKEYNIINEGVEAVFNNNYFLGSHTRIFYVVLVNINDNNNDINKKNERKLYIFDYLFKFNYENRFLFFANNWEMKLLYSFKFLLKSFIIDLFLFNSFFISWISSFISKFE